MIKIQDGKRFKANSLNGQNKSQPQQPNRKPLPPKQKQPPPAPTLPPKPPNHPNPNMTIAFNPTNTNNVNKTDSNNNSVECDRCGMTFLNENLLVIHKEKFCTGTQQSQEAYSNNYRAISPPIQSKYIQQNSNKLQLKGSLENLSPRQPLSRISFGSEDNVIANLNPIKTQSAIYQLKNYKNKKSIEQSLKDMEDTLIRDTIRDKKLATSFHNSPTPNQQTSNNQIARSLLSLSQMTGTTSNDPFRHLLTEYSEFKKKEKSVLQEIYDYSPDLIPWSVKTVEDKENTDINPSNDFLSLFDNSELDVIEDLDAIDYLDTIDFSPSQNKKSEAQSQPQPIAATNANNNGKKKPANITNNNKKTKTDSKADKMNSEQVMRANLKRIQEKAVQLEKDRREIQYKLEMLRNDNSIPLPVQSNQSINRILSELKNQQRINEAALGMLSQRLNAGPNFQPPASNNFNSVRSNNSFNRIDFSKYLNGPYHSYSLSNDRISNPNEDSYSAEEIRIMRLNYLQGGGHDPNVLHKFTEMEYDARFKDINNNQNNRFSSRPSNSQIEPLHHPKSHNKIVNELKIQNEAIRRSFQSESNQNITMNRKNFENENFELEKLLSKNNQSIEMQGPLLASEILVEHLNKSTSNKKKSDPFTIDLDNKIRKVDQENKRLQVELELLQNKYESLSNLHTPSTYEMARKKNETSLPPIHQPSPPIQPRVRYFSPIEHMPNLVPQNRFQNQMDEDAFVAYSPKTVQFSNDPTPTLVQNQPLQKAFQPSKPALKSENFNVPKIIRLKELPPTPYDPVGGFVIFIDFITNIESSYGCARVITCLHHPKSGLGEPSVLPIVNCETFLENNNRLTVALISTKQPVPRCPPQQALTILVELQMAYKDPNETKLKSCAWSKIQLFDTKNRLLSGRWKLSLKNLPIKSDANINTLDSYSSFGSTELYYRLVNLRDSDEQTNAPISPAYANQYVQTTQLINDYEYFFQCLYPEYQFSSQSSQENIKYLNSPKTPETPIQKLQYEKSMQKQESRKFKIKYYTSEKFDESIINSKVPEKNKKINRATNTKIQALQQNQQPIKQQTEKKLEQKNIQEQKFKPKIMEPKSKLNQKFLKKIQNNESDEDDDFYTVDNNLRSQMPNKLKETFQSYQDYQQPDNHKQSQPKVNLFKEPVQNHQEFYHPDERNRQQFQYQSNDRNIPYQRIPPVYQEPQVRQEFENRSNESFSYEDEPIEEKSDEMIRIQRDITLSDVTPSNENIKTNEVLENKENEEDFNNEDQNVDTKSNNEDDDRIDEFTAKKEFDRNKTEKIKQIKRQINYLKNQKSQNYQEIYKHQQTYLKILNEQYNYKPPEASTRRKSKSINNLNEISKPRKFREKTKKRSYFVF